MDKDMKRKMNPKSLENLQKGSAPFKRDPKFASEAGKKGQKAQQELRTARDTYNFILGLKAPEKIKEGLKQLMPDLPEEMNVRLAMYLKTVVEAINGNLRAVEEITNRLDGQAKQDILLSGSLDTGEGNTVTVNIIAPKKDDKD
jgi:general stress protein YciG